MPGDEISLKEMVFTLKEWVTYLFSRWKIILLFGLLGGGLGLAYTFTKKVVYTASLTFAIEDTQQGTGLGGALGLASQFGFDLGGNAGGIFSGLNLIELFKSRTMVEKTLLNPVTVEGKTISFAEMYIQIKELRKNWEKKPGLTNIQFLPKVDRQQFSRVQDSVLGVIYEDISKSSLKVAKKDKKLDILTIDMQSNDEKFAKYFTEALATEVSDFYISTKSKRARLNMSILERQTDSIRGELNGAITGVAIANDNTFGLNPALNVRRAPSARRQVDVQANTAILTELVKQTELARVTVRKETPLIQIIDRPIFPLKKEKFGKARGIVLGGLIAGFLVIMILIGRRIFRNLLAS